MACDHAVKGEQGIARVLQTKEETRAFYNKIASVYDLLAEHSEQPMREIAMKMLAPASGEHLLEVGFGTGHVLARLAQAVGPTGKVSGLDISENMLAQARERLEQEGLADRVRVHDRLCAELKTVSAYGGPARTMGVEICSSTVLAEVSGAALQKGLRSLPPPELLRALDSLIELLDQRLHDRTGHRQTFPTIAGVIHAGRLVDDIVQNQRHDLARMVGFRPRRHRTQTLQVLAEQRLDAHPLARPSRPQQLLLQPPSPKRPP